MKTIKLTKSQLSKVLKKSASGKSKVSNETWYVQETIGGWRQNPMFSGSYQECSQFLKNTYINGSVALVSETELEIDYLNDEQDDEIGD